MKLWSKEALVLGGIYGVLDTPFSLLGFELISNVVFLLFIIWVGNWNRTSEYRFCRPVPYH